MVLDLDAYNQLLGLVYEAAVVPDHWRSVMERLADLTGGYSAWLSRLNLHDGSGSGVVVRMDPRVQDDYFSHYNAVDPLCNVDDPRSGPEPLVPYLITDEDRLAKAELRRTEFYNDFMRPIDAHSVLMMRLVVRGTTVYGLNINRAERHGPFDPADMRLAGALQGHLGRSLQLAQRFEALQLLEPDGAGAPGQKQGLMVLESDGRIVFADPVAEALLRRQAGLVVAGGRLGAVDRDASQRLRALVATAASPRPDTRRGGAVAVPSPSRRLPLLVAVAPLPPGRLFLFGDRRLAAVSVSDLDAGDGLPDRALAQLFGVTAAEARVAHELSRGHSIQEIAGTLDISVSTVRTHVAHLFGKTGVRRQAELVRLLARLPADPALR